jgi:hypothetical protein
MAHTYYPVYLYKNERRLHLANDTVAPHTKLEPGADPLNPESYARYNLTEYAPDVMFSEMIHFVKENWDDGPLKKKGLTIFAKRGIHTGEIWSVNGIGILAFDYIRFILFCK